TEKLAEQEKVAKEATELATALSATPAAGTKQHALVEALAVARAGFEQSNARLTASRSEVERWNRAQAFMTVHRAEQSYSDLKAKHDELIETAKDALRPIEMTQQQIAAF